MKVVVNSGRTVRTVVKPAVKQADGSYSPPSLKSHGPTRRIDVPEDEAKFLIERGFVHEDKPIEEAEPAKAEPAKDSKSSDKK